MKQAALHTSKKMFLPLHRENSFHQRRFLGNAINLWLIFLFVSPSLFAQGAFSAKTDFVTADSLAAYYPFSGNANDSSGNGHNATVVNATLTSNRFGADSSAYSFNGTSGTIQYGDILDEIFCAPVAKFSIVGWAKTRTCGNYTTGGGMIMSKSSGGGGMYQWNITHQENLVNVIVVSDGIAQNYLWLVSPMATNQWFQFALIFDGSLPEMQRLKLYVNGQSSNASVYKNFGTLGTTTQNSTQHVCIGASHEFGNPQALHSFYDGTIDDIRIYAKALAQEEIDSLYHEGGWNNPPIANAGSDRTIIADSSGTAEVTLNGSASSDPDGDSLTYLWREGPDTLGFGPAAQTTVTLPPGIHTITLTVDDGNGGSDTDDVVITVVDFPNDLAAYYPFNGNANDESGNGFHGTIHGSALTSDRFGIAGNAYQFNGSNNYIDLGYQPALSLTEGTVITWIKTASTQLSQVLVLGQGQGKPQLVIVSGKARVQWGATDKTFPGLTSSRRIDDTVWHCVAGVWSQSGFKIYVDGKLEGSLATQLAQLSSNCQIQIGGFNLPICGGAVNPYVGQFLNGKIDDIRIFSRQLTEAEIDSLYHDGGWADQKNNSLFAYYPFNGNANDESGNGSNGIVYGATLTTDRFGKSNSAYHFTGGTYVRIPELFPDSCQAFTFAAWVKKKALDDNRHVIIYKGIQKGEASLIITPGVLGFGVNLYVPGTPSNTQNWHAANVTDTLKANTYYFIVGRYKKGEKIDLWINGKEVSSTTIPNLNLVSDPLKTYSAIGNHTEPSHSFTDGWNGIIDDVRIYTRAISAAEIDSLYHEGSWDIQPNRPLAYYPFNANANDESGNGYNGTVHGATTTKDRFNNDSSAMSFNGINNIIDVGDVLDEIFCDSVATFTVSAWAKADIISGPLPIITKSAGGTGPYQWTVGINMAGLNGLATGEIYSDTVAQNYIQLKRPVIANQWYHFVLVFDGSLPENNRAKFYINGRTDSVYVGVKVGTVGTTTVNSQQYITIGGTHEPGNTQIVASPFSGAIDDVRIYGRSLSAAEIDSLYHEGGWPIDPTTSVPLSRLGTEIPESFHLYDNYPNPFNPSTTIRFAIPQEEFVTLKVYDMLGKEVATLVNEYLTPGIYSLRYNVRGISSSIYFYRLKAGAAVQTKRMMLLK